MSAHIESPINGSINEAIKEINQAPKINETVACLEETLCNGTESAAAEISGKFVFETENCQDNKENEACATKVSDIHKANGIIYNTESEKITNGSTEESEKLHEPVENADHTDQAKNHELNLESLTSDKIISTEADGCSTTETKTPSSETVIKDTIETDTSDAHIQNDADFSDNTTSEKELDIPDIAKNTKHGEPKTLNSTVESDNLTTINLESPRNNMITNEVTKVDEPRLAPTDNESNVLAEKTNSATVNASDDVEMTEVSDLAENSISHAHDSQCVQITDDAKTAPVNKTNLITKQNENLKQDNEDIPVTEIELTSTSDNNKSEIIDAADVISKDITSAAQDIDESVLKSPETTDENCLLNDEKNAINDIMETDSGLANVDKESFMETDDTDAIKLAGDKVIVDLDINSSTHDTKTVDLENEIKSLDHNTPMETDDVDLVNTTETKKIDGSPNLNKINPSLDIVDCSDVVIDDKVEAEKAGAKEVIGGVLEKKESEDSVILCEDIDTKNETPGGDLEKKEKSGESIILCEELDSEDTTANIPKNDNAVDSTPHIEKPIDNGLGKVDITDEDDVKIVEKDNKFDEDKNREKSTEKEVEKSVPVVCKLSNTLDILSDEEEEASTDKVPDVPKSSSEDKPCINIDEDDDIMFIEEDADPKESAPKENVSNSTEDPKPHDTVDVETGENQATNITDLMPKSKDKESAPEQVSTMELDSTPQIENKPEESNKSEEYKSPLLPQNFLKTAKKNLASMSRHELEDFCILRIVESIVDRSNLSDIKTKIKTMAQNLEEYRKKALMLTKQNRDLQVVLKSVQEEQKKRTNGPIQPLKITRSVGMQVLMNDKLDPRRKMPIPTPPPAVNTALARPVRSTTMQKQNKPPGPPPNIPVPRKVPIVNSPAKAITNTPANGNKSASPSPAAMRNPSPVQKVPEKRTHSRMQGQCSVTVDLTDDEPPSKINNKNSGTSAPPVRVVPSHNLLAQNRQLANPNQALSSPRKVYIPISGPQGIRPGQAVMMKNGPTPGLRPRIPSPRASNIRPKQIPRHPAPLPDAMKQYTPPTWKNLPPAPDLKLSKVENGIVISWKIDGYPDGAYETIASYQLYAYQETSAPPNTANWKKIGDVKALPLPMACTLTQFMAGFKYYFAVRAVDIRSRLGPFSLPGSILLLNKV